MESDIKNCHSNSCHKEYDPVNMEENIITNQASLKAKDVFN